MIIVLPVVIIIILSIAPVAGFMTVYQGFNLRGIACFDSCIDYLDNIVNKLNRIDVDIVVPVEE